MESIELSRHRLSLKNPYAPPDRRYRIARLCWKQRVLPLFCGDDPPTWAIWRYVCRRAAAQDGGQHVQLIKKEHGLWLAFRLHHGGMKHLRPILEAYLLAGLDDSSLAKKVGATAEAIRWFRLAFYDVQRYLRAPAYVRLHLIRTVDDEGQTTLDSHRLWKLLGYTLGPNALDELLGDFAANKEAFEIGGLAGWFFQQTRAVLQGKQFMSASNLPPDDHKHIAILLRLLLEELRSQKQPDDQQSATFESHINAMLQELPWCKGPERTPEPVRVWDEKAVELNSDELMLLAAGEKVPHLEELKNLEIFGGSRQDHSATGNSGEAE